MPEITSHFQGRHAESAQELLAFATEGELYGVQLGVVQEIVVPPPITFVPRAPRAVLGVCSVRGRLITVVDFRVCLGLPSSPLQQRRGRILLGQGPDDEAIGLRVDEVRQVVRLGAGELEWTVQALGGDYSETFLRGIGRPAGGDELLVIDMKAVLAKGCS
ncbi:MAG TPA: chemotaxis protein CheW [Polyangiaceae bacterium]|nr:chemotaxis protein CheW [Polyangiaceae bacterium]